MPNLMVLLMLVRLTMAMLEMTLFLALRTSRNMKNVFLLVLEFLLVMVDLPKVINMVFMVQGMVEVVSLMPKSTMQSLNNMVAILDLGPMLLVLVDK